MLVHTFYNQLSETENILYVIHASYSPKISGKIPRQLGFVVLPMIFLFSEINLVSFLFSRMLF